MREMQQRLTAKSGARMYELTTTQKSAARFVALALAIFYIVSLSGCGSTSSPSNTPPPQSSALTISNITASSITATGAIITWSTNVNGTSQVDYGTTTNYGISTTFNSTIVTSH